MRIAVASDGLDVAQSFVRCQNFNYYTTCSYEVAEVQNMPAQGFTAEKYAAFMSKMGVNVLICGDISDNARLAFENQHIQVISGKHGDALQAASDYIDERALLLDNDFLEEECAEGDI